MKLLIVESPSKAKTIQKYVGKDYKVIASKGHILDLPPNGLGIDINTWKLDIQPIKGKEDVIKEIKDLAKKADEIYLAPDPDREGEAIAFHLLKIIGKKKPVYRVTFNSITKDSVHEALKIAGELNSDMNDAQKARRVLDRLVGYKISPLLWKKVSFGLSAGRVQSVALKIIIDRENKIKSFVAENWFSLRAFFNKDNIKFSALYFGKNKEKKVVLDDFETADKIKNSLVDKEFNVDEIIKEEVSRKSFPPFTTSSLQQSAVKKLKMTTKEVMEVAQKLYEGKSINGNTMGLITYMRTDSTRTDPKFLEKTHEYLKENHTDIAIDKLREFKTKGNAQDAHEAIRPTSLDNTPDVVKSALNDSEFALYSLIWKRYLAAQCKDALFDKTTLWVSVGDHMFKATGQVQKFKGFLEIYEESVETKSKGKGDEDELISLPIVSKDEKIKQISPIEMKEKFTSPPARYTEASLVKTLETKGIGRPSTYASIISTLLFRNYIKRDKKYFFPTTIGHVLVEVLNVNFPKEMEIAFTAKVEKLLDDISEGTVSWKRMLKDFWTIFEKELSNATKNIHPLKPKFIPLRKKCTSCENGLLNIMFRNGKTIVECSRCKEKSNYSLKENKLGEKFKIEKHCPKCSSPMERKQSKHGEFFGCTEYPACKTTLSVESTGIKCVKCNKGEYAPKKSKKGNIFYGCSNYPSCDGVFWDKPILYTCTHCKYPISLEKNGKKVCGKCKKDI
jgi:DNA topoisomerase I